MQGMQAIHKQGLCRAADSCHEATDGGYQKSLRAHVSSRLDYATSELPFDSIELVHLLEAPTLLTEPALHASNQHRCCCQVLLTYAVSDAVRLAD